METSGTSWKHSFDAKGRDWRWRHRFSNKHCRDHCESHGLDVIIEGKRNSWRKAEKNLLKNGWGETVEKGGMENLQRSGRLRIKIIFLDF